MLLTDSDGKIVPFVISDFRGGMRMDVDSTKLEKDEYFLLINGRSRDGKLRPVKLPLQDTSIVGERFQCIFGTGSTIIMIIDGKLVAKNYEGVDPNFSRPAFDPLSASVDTIYGEFIPTSNINFQRTLPPGTFNIKTGEILFTSSVDSSPRALILQDGERQPKLVFPDSFSSRNTQNFASWTIDNREYVPKGKQMLYHNGVLYIISVDGSEIYHSVTGRPLDFVIGIEGEEGNKITDGAYTEEASRLSHKLAFEPITTIASLNIASDNPDVDPPFYVGTKHSSFIVYPDIVDTIFGEPTFKNVGLFPTGPLNHNSFIEMDGDYGFISASGIRSFNAVAQTKNEGKNSLFSLFVHPLFIDPASNEYLAQTATAAWNFDNYSLFAVNTIYGYGILVFDNLAKKYSALDIYPSITAPIKQFAEIIVNGKHRLFFITATGYYEAFAGPVATMRCLPREFNTNNLHIEHSLNKVRVVMDSIQAPGSLVVTEYIDRRKGEVKTKALVPNVDANPLPMTPPYGVATSDSIREENISFEESKRGYKIGIEVALNALTDIVEIQILPKVFVEESSEAQRAS
jgi:hypothetical protein